MIKTYKQAKDYSYSLMQPASVSIKEMDKFISAKKYAEVLGNPQFKYPTIHIAGTSGKGSTSYFISKILNMAGYKTGLHLSPHLHSIRERAQVNNKKISKYIFVKLINEVKPLVDKLNRQLKYKITFIQFMQGFAFFYFAKKKVDIAVVETGLGGTYDGTNVLKPLISVITPIDYDHTHILGKKLEQIAQHKAGIIKKGQLAVISAKQRKSAQKILRKRVKSLKIPIYEEEKDFYIKIKRLTTRGVLFDYFEKDKKITNIFSSLVGPHQAHNAALAIKTILELKKNKYKIRNSHIKKALSDSIYYGRFEITKTNNKIIILDGAHNQHKFTALVETLMKIYPKEKFICIFSCKKNKEIEKVAKILNKKVKLLIATQFSHPTNIGPHSPLEASTIAKKLKKAKFKGSIFEIPSIKKAVLYVLTEVNKKNKILITGSFHTVSEVQNILRKYIKNNKTKPKN